MESLAFLAAPLTACLLMVAILSYFGNHILSRGVIFVDIAVAQVAALGTMIGILFGAAEGSALSTAISLGFTLIIVSLFAVSKFQHKELSQEVIIGIIYCMAIAVAYLLVDSVEGGSNFLQKTFNGSILWVSWAENLKTVILFGAVAGIHFFIHPKTSLISQQQEDKLSGSQIKLLDLIFYITFGIIIVHAVRIGGIFLVFMYLIAPAAMASFLTESWKGRFIYSFIFGALGSITGVILSYHFNLPNGPMIVAILGVFLLIIVIVSNKWQ